MVLSLPPFAMEALVKHRAAQVAHRLRVGEFYYDQGFVLAHEARRSFKPAVVTQQFGILVERPGLPKVTYHSVGHSHASFLVLPGVALKVVSERLGHSNIAITADLYSHLLGEDGGAAQHIEAAFRRAGEG